MKCRIGKEALGGRGPGSSAICLGRSTSSSPPAGTADSPASLSKFLSNSSLCFRVSLQWRKSLWIAHPISFIYTQHKRIFFRVAGLGIPSSCCGNLLERLHVGLLLPRLNDSCIYATSHDDTAVTVSTVALLE